MDLDQDDWQKFLLSPPVVVVSLAQPSRYRLLCLNKTCHAVEEGPGVWSMNHQLIAALLPYAIVELVAKDRVNSLLDIMSPSYT